jgi:hypothetical protein
MQSSLPSKVNVASRAPFIGAPANDNSRLPKCLLRDAWWLEPGGAALSINPDFINTGTHRHD